MALELQSFVKGTSHEVNSIPVASNSFKVDSFINNRRLEVSMKKVIKVSSKFLALLLVAGSIYAPSVRAEAVRDRERVEIPELRELQRRMLESPKIREEIFAAAGTEARVSQAFGSEGAAVVKALKDLTDKAYGTKGTKAEREAAKDKLYTDHMADLWKLTQASGQLYATREADGSVKFHGPRWEEVQSGKADAATTRELKTAAAVTGDIDTLSQNDPAMRAQLGYALNEAVAKKGQLKVDDLKAINRAAETLKKFDGQTQAQRDAVQGSASSLRAARKAKAAGTEAPTDETASTNATIKHYLSRLVAEAVKNGHPEVANKLVATAEGKNEEDPTAPPDFKSAAATLKGLGALADMGDLAEGSVIGSFVGRLGRSNPEYKKLSLATPADVAKAKEKILMEHPELKEELAKEIEKETEKNVAELLIAKLDKDGIEGIIKNKCMPPWLKTAGVVTAIAALTGGGTWAFCKTNAAKCESIHKMVTSLPKSALEDAPASDKPFDNKVQKLAIPDHK